jgi:chromosome segregation ATPase
MNINTIKALTNNTQNLPADKLLVDAAYQRSLNMERAKERSRAASAETKLSRLQDELHNAVFHRDGIIKSLERQLEHALSQLDETLSQLEKAHDRIKELEETVNV